MNRRGFLRSAFASTATIVVAPACVLEALADEARHPGRVFVDMGRNAFDPFTLPIHDMVFDPFVLISDVLEAMYGRRVAKQNMLLDAHAFSERVLERLAP